MLKCWICGAPADSSEHKFKKSNLIGLWGKGPYRNSTELIHLREESQRVVQGPNSKWLKFNKTLCHECNTNFTQPFDKAYDQFIGWFDNNKEKVLKLRLIDFSIVFGKNWEDKQLNLFKFFTKALGCSIANVGHSVPKDLRKLLSKRHFRTGLRVSFYVAEYLAQLPEKDHGVGIYPLLFIKRNFPFKSGYSSGQVYRWLIIRYWYLYPCKGNLGTPWTANSQLVYLGSDNRKVHSV